MKNTVGIKSFPVRPASVLGQIFEPSDDQKLRAMGGLIYLTQGSALHRQYSVDLLLRRVGPCLQRGAFRYYEEADGRPVAFCCWVFLSDSVWSDIAKTGREIDPNELNSGTNYFFPEFLAPFGHVYRVISDLKRNVFPHGAKGYGIRGTTVYETTTIRVQRYSTTKN